MMTKKTRTRWTTTNIRTMCHAMREMNEEAAALDEQRDGAPPFKVVVLGPGLFVFVPLDHPFASDRSKDPAYLTDWEILGVRPGDVEEGGTA